MMLLSLVGNDAIIAPEPLITALRARYGPLHIARPASRRGNALNIGILADDFQPIVDLGDDLATISIQGTWDEAAEIAAVVRAAMPPDGPELHLIDDDGAHFADVPIGSTPESVTAGWRDIPEFPDETDA